MPSRPSSAQLATAWLAAALILLPWAYRIAWDTSRAVPLVLLSPALWLGRDLVTRRLGRLFSMQNRALLLVAIFAAAVVFSIVASAHWAASITTASTWCVLALTAILVAELVHQDARSSRMLLGSLVVSFGVGTAAHWFRWKTGHSSHDGFYVHPRLMGIHALSAALAAVAMLAHSWSGRGTWRILWLPLGILAWAGLLWSGSRSPLVGIAGALLVWILKVRGRERVRLVLATGALCVGGMLLSRIFWTDAVGLGWWHLAQRTAVTQTAEQITSNRSSFWTDAAMHANASPWIGYGPDAYAFLTPQLEGTQPHNLALQLMLDVGALGALAALGLIAWCLWRGWKTPATDALSAAWFALAVGSVVAAQLDGYFYYPLASIAAWLSLGGCAARTGSAAPALQVELVRPGVARGWAGVAVGASAVLLLNCWLFHRAVHGAPPDRPDAFVVQVWRVFPSVTYNIDTWVDAWAGRFPQDALATSRFARRHSQSPEVFRVKTAGLLSRHGYVQEAVAELELARAEVRPENRPVVDQLLRRLQSAADGR